MVDTSQLLADATSGEFSVPALSDQIINSLWRVEGCKIIGGKITVAAVCSPEIAQHIVNEHNAAWSRRFFGATLPQPFSVSLLLDWLEEKGVTRYTITLYDTVSLSMEVLVYSDGDYQKVHDLVATRVPLIYSVKVALDRTPSKRRKSQ